MKTASDWVAELERWVEPADQHHNRTCETIRAAQDDAWNEAIDAAAATAIEQTHYFDQYGGTVAIRWCTPKEIALAITALKRPVKGSDA